MVTGLHYNISKNPQLDLKIKEVCMNQVQETKLLGVVIDDKLTWKTHKQSGQGIFITKIN